MLGKQMTVHFPYEHPAILVAKPLRDSLEIYARHDRHAGEVMPEIVEAHPI